ncbi:mitochondrial 28S ribosomal protein S33, putative [Pediculus humanus corporis]|uniref:Small ribosomal subunit protein mS33 n=1 Tax=Pediculus humanus subsp. corporis TaxID=121224 RepID=E0VTA4_PEDHC|nr:mitochondrial 28S ribosomal protein S33, putative [Pediculus humanus corporis]EEB16610.1 mitochondrial 28S ribosomal protein S33, putative [Pediculus humanus corporis]
MNKYLKLVQVKTPYNERISRLRNRIFGDPLTKRQQESMRVVKLFSEKPLYKRTEVVDYYPKYGIIEELMVYLRRYGLYRDEHKDFVEHMEKVRLARGKPKWKPKRISKNS